MIRSTRPVPAKARSVAGLGAKMAVPELVRHATGKPLSAAPYLRYLERKYLSEW